jgi:hypothetical protein
MLKIWRFLVAEKPEFLRSVKVGAWRCLLVDRHLPAVRCSMQVRTAGSCILKTGRLALVASRTAVSVPRVGPPSFVQHSTNALGVLRSPPYLLMGFPESPGVRHRPIAVSLRRGSRL